MRELKPANPRKKADTATSGQRRKLIDEFILLDQEIDAYKHKQYRHSKLRELILGWYPQLPAEDEARLAGTDWDILVSSRDKIRAVTMQGKQRLFKEWGAREFVSQAVIYIKSLPDPQDKNGLYTQQTLSGPRHLHVIAKGTAVAATPAKAGSTHAA